MFWQSARDVGVAVFGMMTVVSDFHFLDHWSVLKTVLNMFMTGTVNFG